jgi:hypothetical protein
MLYASGTALSCPSFWALLVLPDNLVFPRWSLPTLQATSFKSLPSIGLLQLLASCSGMPELLVPSVGLLELLDPCCGVPELLAPWEVTLMCRILTAGVSMLPLAWMLSHAPVAVCPQYCLILSTLVCFLLVFPEELNLPQVKPAYLRGY